MPLSFLIALIITAADGPKSDEVLPVTISPFGSSNASAGALVFSAFSLAMMATLRSDGDIVQSFINSSIFLTADAGIFSSLKSTKSLIVNCRMIPSFAAEIAASISVDTETYHVYTHICRGCVWRFVRIRSIVRFEYWNTSISRL